MAGTATRVPSGYTLVKSGVTAAEYAGMAADERRLELIDGELVMAPSHSSGHSFVGMRLAHRIMNWCESRKLGEFHVEVDVRVAEDCILRPDFTFISGGHPQAGQNVPRFTSPPDMVIEVISPESRTRDWREKFGYYEAFGIPNYWIVDPFARSISAFALANGAYREVPQKSETQFEAPPFPGLVLNLDDVFGPAR